MQYGEGGLQVSFQANRTSEGTWPRGSQWTRNPIPACAGPWGGYNEAEAHCFQEDGATQFPPPGPGSVRDQNILEKIRMKLFQDFMGSAVQ